MAGAYGLLGVAAAWSGQNLQMALQSPIAIGMMSVVFVLLALSMFGLFELRLPAALTARFSNAQVGGKGSLASAGFLGFTSALIVGPCVTPPPAGPDRTSGVLGKGGSGRVDPGGRRIIKNKRVHEQKKKRPNRNTTP